MTTAAPIAYPAPAPAPGRTLGRIAWRWVAALAVAAAGALHVVAAAEHLAAGELVVGFFLVAAFAQLGVALWLVVTSWPGVPPSPPLVAAAIAGTVALLALYVVAHTTDLFAAYFGTDAAAATGHGHAAGSGTEPTGHAIETEGAVSLGEAPEFREPPGLLGTATVAVEVLGVAALAALLPASWRARTINALLALGAGAWLLWLTGVLG